MPSILTQTLRLLARRWPQLLAWFLAGWLARYLLIELAAFVGAGFALGGLMIIPLAILARLVSFVAMFLVLRDDMPNLRRVAADPLPKTGAERRAAFLDAVLVSILPFFAFYYAWGLLAQDYFAYARSAIDNYFASADAFDPERISYTEVDRLSVDVLTVAVIVVAFAGRWALKRWRARLPRWTAVIGVYLEAVWVFLTVYLIAGFFESVRTWVDTRQAMAWLADIREWLGQFVTPLAWVWDAVEWVLAEAGGLVLQPLAWLAIAGVIYGRAIAARTVEVRAAGGLRRRYGSLPTRVRRRVGDLWADITGRFRPLGRAILTIWHAGAIPMGVFVLGYTIVMSLQAWLRWGINTAIGPHELQPFWIIVDGLVLLVVVAVIEPLRVALVAAAYDHALGELSPTERDELEQPVADAAGPEPTSDGPDAEPAAVVTAADRGEAPHSGEAPRSSAP